MEEQNEQSIPADKPLNSTLWLEGLKMELLEILKHIDAEPELPGDPPDEMKALLLSAIIEKDVDILVKALRRES